MGWSARCGPCGQIGYVNWFPLFEIPPLGFNPFSKNYFFFFGFFRSGIFSLFPISCLGFNPFSKNLEWVGPRDVVRAVKLALQIGFPCLRKSILESLPRD